MGSLKWTLDVTQEILLIGTDKVGYDKAAEIPKKAYKEGKTIREVAREETDYRRKTWIGCSTRGLARVECPRFGG